MRPAHVLRLAQDTLALGERVLGRCRLVARGHGGLDLVDRVVDFELGGLEYLICRTHVRAHRAQRRRRCFTIQSVPGGNFGSAVVAARERTEQTREFALVRRLRRHQLLLDLGLGGMRLLDARDVGAARSTWLSEHRGGHRVACREHRRTSSACACASMLSSKLACRTAISSALACPVPGHSTRCALGRTVSARCEIEAT